MSVKKKDNLNNRKLLLVVTILLIVVLLILASLRVMTTLSGVSVESRVNELEKFTKEKDNPKAVAWLKVPGTDIDYPVLSEYDGIKYQSGDIQYLWANGNLEKNNEIYYIMGHNVMNLSKNPLIREKTHVRFEQLMSFTYLDFAKENEYIQLTIDGEDYLFKIFSVSYPKTYETKTDNISEMTKEYKQEQIDTYKEESIFNYDVDVTTDDKIISLITCTRMFGRETDFQVAGRMVRKGESTRNYKVTESKKFDEVKIEMKGEQEQDEEA